MRHEWELTLSHTLLDVTKAKTQTSSFKFESFKLKERRGLPRIRVLGLLSLNQDSKAATGTPLTGINGISHRMLAASAPLPRTKRKGKDLVLKSCVN